MRHIFVSIRSRYTQLMAEAISDILPDHKTRDSAPKSALDIFLEHRLEVARQHDQDILDHPDTAAQFPPELLRRFEVYWEPRKPAKVEHIRDLKADHVSY